MILPSDCMVTAKPSSSAMPKSVVIFPSLPKVGSSEPSAARDVRTNVCDMLNSSLKSNVVGKVNLYVKEYARQTANTRDKTAKNRQSAVWRIGIARTHKYSYENRESTYN